MRKIMSLIMCMVCMICLLTACKVEKGDNKDIGEVDPAASHINLSLSENVTIDADITPEADYADGLAVYYGRLWSEDYGFDSYQDHPTFYGKSIADIVSLLEECGIGNFTEEALQNMTVEDDYGPDVTLTDLDGKDIYMSASEEENQITTWVLRFPYPDVDDYSSVRSIAQGMYDLNSYMDGTALEAAGIDCSNARKFMEGVTGFTLSDQTVCIPLTEMGEDCYAVYFFPEVDGFPTYMVSHNVEYEQSADVSDNVLDRQEIEDHVARISNLWFRPWFAYYKDGQIVGIEMYPTVYVGEQYSEKEDIVGIEEIVAQIRNYFEKNYVSDPITITDITLAYNGWVNDGSNGKEVEHIVSPFWYVWHCDEGSEEWKSRCMLFDAFSGEFVTEQAFLW